MLVDVPTRVYLTKGVGVRKEDKNARDRASVEAGLSRQNLLTLSSVLPPGVRVIGRNEYQKAVREGEVVMAVNGVCQSNVPGMVVTAGMAFAIPHDKEDAGYVTELYETPGIDPEVMKERVEKSAIQIMGDQQTGGSVDPAGVWERGRTTYDFNGKAVDIYSMIATGVVPYSGDYLCALVAAVFLK